MFGIFKIKKIFANNSGDDLAKKLYSQNIEVVERNKVLLLLRRLYQLAIKDIELDKLAESIANDIRDELEFELVGIFTYEAASDHLKPLKFATSERFKKAESKNLNAILSTVIIPKVSSNRAFKSMLKGGAIDHASGLGPVWQEIVDLNLLRRVEVESNIKSALLYPLVAGEKVIGALFICINRRYDELTQFERESIENFINVTAVALDRALLYQNIKEANIKLKELDEMKSQFLSFASHQVKAPMAVVKGFAELIGEGAYGPVNDKIKETSGRIISSADKLIDLVSNILDTRKIEEGKMNYDFQKTDLVAMARDVIGEMKPLADDKKLDLMLDAKILSVPIKADVRKFRQVILNLIDNAIKYTPTGFVKAQISFDEKDPANVLIDVSDSGFGISKELLPRLFNEFSRGKEQGKQILGTGLGLFIAKQIVKDHGGDMWAESDGEGKGSKFSVKVPVAR